MTKFNEIIQSTNQFFIKKNYKCKSYLRSKKGNARQVITGQTKFQIRLFDFVVLLLNDVPNNYVCDKQQLHESCIENR